MKYIKYTIILMIIFLSYNQLNAQSCGDNLDWKLKNILEKIYTKHSNILDKLINWSNNKIKSFFECKGNNNTTWSTKHIYYQKSDFKDVVPNFKNSYWAITYNQIRLPYNSYFRKEGYKYNLNWRIWSINIKTWKKCERYKPKDDCRRFATKWDNYKIFIPWSDSWIKSFNLNTYIWEWNWAPSKWWSAYAKIRFNQIPRWNIMDKNWDLIFWRGTRKLYSKETENIKSLFKDEKTIFFSQLNSLELEINQEQINNFIPKEWGFLYISLLRYSDRNSSYEWFTFDTLKKDDYNYENLDSRNYNLEERWVWIFAIWAHIQLNDENKYKKWLWISTATPTSNIELNPNKWIKQTIKKSSYNEASNDWCYLLDTWKYSNCHPLKAEVWPCIQTDTPCN